MTTTPFPLGRKQYHDPRNAQLQYAIGELPSAAVKSVNWARAVPVFDQGQLGSCVGNAAAGWVGTDNAARAGLVSVPVSQLAQLDFSNDLQHRSGKYRITSSVPVDEAFAVRVYALATSLDSFQGTYPPTDTGTDGPSGAKALTRLGAATKYSHAFSVSALNSALQTGPVMWGTVWYNSMFDPDSSNTLVVDSASGVAGGHELLITGYDASTGEYVVTNSWGSGWGDHGYCYVKGPDMKSLLAQGGDLTQPVTSPVVPSPSPTVVTDAQLYAAFQGFKAVADAWASSRNM